MRIARSLVSFIDGSYLFVELTRRVEPGDTVLICHKVTGLPQGAPADKPTIAASMVQLASAGDYIEVVIPMSRVNGVSIQEETLSTQVSSDVAEMWQPPGRAKK